MTTKSLAAGLWSMALCVAAAACAVEFRGDGDGRAVAVAVAALPGDPHVLSGTVFGGGAPLAGATVEALADGTMTVVAGDVTGADGRYEMTLLEAATYDLRVTPPASSGFREHAVQNVVMPDADAQHDIILVQDGGLSGRVTGYGGAAIAGAGVNVYGVDSGTFVLVATLLTDAEGRYRINLSDGEYALQLSPSLPSAAAPASWGLFQHDVVVSGDTTFDIALPVARITGQVTDDNGVPVSGVQVLARSERSDETPPRRSWSGEQTAMTDASGSYELLVPTGTAAFMILPPADSELPARVEQGVVVDGDAVHDFQLEPGGLSGRVAGYGGAAIAGAGVNVYGVDSGTFVLVATLLTDAEGRYRINLSDGEYALQLSPSLPSAAAPASWGLFQHDVVVSGDTTFDIALPVARITGQVTDDNGVPVSGVQVLARSERSDETPPRRSWSGEQTAMTDASGSYELLVPTGTAAFMILPPADSELPARVEQGVVVDGDAVHDFQLEPGGLSGRVAGYGGAAIAGAGVNVYGVDSGTFVLVATLLTDAEGRYRINLSDGEYALQLSPSLPSAAAPASWGLFQHDVVVSGDTTFDIALPVARITGQVTDDNGVPVSGVQVLARSERSDETPPRRSWSGEQTAMTDASGRYELLAVTGTAAFQITPPSQSGFAASILSGVAITRDFAQTIILEHPDLSPPVIGPGPIVSRVSDTWVMIEWKTDEEASSSVEYRIGALTRRVNRGALTDDHTVTLTGLQPNTTYDYRVGSADRSGNGPTWSTMGQFTTQPPPGDTTQAVIVAGPDIAYVSDTQAIVTWRTDDPSTSVVRFATSAALAGTDSGPSVALAAAESDPDDPGVDFVREHAVLQTGLTPSTTYFVQIESANPDGNPPTTSDVVQFTTAVVPDTTAPVITSGPTIEDVSDRTITVSWTTDEPATSGASFNDGVAFDLVSDGSLVTHHVMTLANLAPDTSYELTVSSSDPVGNGPTLAGPVEATTEVEPDLTPPVLGGLNAIDISETSALVVWTTDEPATSEVRFGLVQGAPDGISADVALVTEHAVLLSGLLAGQIHHLSASSTDISGNTGSGATSFQTASPDTDGDGLPDAEDNCPAQHPGPVDADHDGCPDGISISIADASLTERHSGTANMVFTVTLSRASATAVTVRFATANGSATAGSDYVARTGTLRFSAGALTRTIAVQVRGDRAFEPDETLRVELSAPVGASLRRSSAVGTIVNDDAPPPTISIADASRLEGARGSASMTFQVTLSSASSQTVRVDYATHDGTPPAGALAPSDYAARSQTLTFAAGTTTAAITVPINGDRTVEPDETFTVVLGGPVNATIADGTATGTIRNDD